MDKDLWEIAGGASLLEDSIRLIREFEDVAIARNPLGYVVGYSGGKDSDVLVELFRRAGVRFIVIHNHTTLDAPDTVYYIRRRFAEWEAQGIECRVYYPELSFWQLCEKHRMLPQRTVRFCCTELKEKPIPELRFATHAFGVRRAESVRRAKFRDSIEMGNRSDYTDKQNFHFDNTADVRSTGACYSQNFFYVNPLAYWSDRQLWDFIASEHIEINPLYGCGFSRVGCVGCPMAGAHRETEFARYPKYRDNFIRLCDRIIAQRNADGRSNKYGFKTGQEYFDFWMTGEREENLPLLAEEEDKK